MDALRTAVLCACMAALGLTLAEGVLPVERFSRQIRLMFAALMMTVLLKPLTALHFTSLHTESQQTEDYRSEITDLAADAQAQAVSESILHALNQQLEARAIPCRVTGISAHISESGSIVINEVRVNGNLLTGAVCLREWLGSDVTITEEEG